MRQAGAGVRRLGITAMVVSVVAIMGGCTGAQPDDAPKAPPSSAPEPSSAPVVLPGAPGDVPRVAGPAEVSRLGEQDDASKAGVDYVRMMIAHHQQALAMTAMAPERARNPQVRALAARIDDAQGAEIGMMQGWLERNGLQPVADDRARRLGDHHRSMMGMATREEMARLKASTGTDFDRLFLKLMSTHHQGAVDMGIELLKKGEEPMVRSMAKDVMASQRDEIAVMQDLLADIG